MDKTANVENPYIDDNETVDITEISDDDEAAMLESMNGRCFNMMIIHILWTAIFDIFYSLLYPNRQSVHSFVHQMQYLTLFIKNFLYLHPKIKIWI